MSGEIAAWIKIAYSILLALIVPAYLAAYGLVNFLWFSDIALVVTGVALWLESRLLASMMAVGVLLLELGWILSLCSGLLFGSKYSVLADYMFESEKPLYLRMLSLLFHLVVPVVLLWMLYKLGYDPNAWIAQTLLAWLVLPLTYWLSPPEQNINWVFGPGRKRQEWVPPLAYLALLMLFFPLCIYLPTHMVLLVVIG